MPKCLRPAAQYLKETQCPGGYSALRTCTLKIIALGACSVEEQANTRRGKVPCEAGETDDEGTGMAEAPFARTQACPVCCEAHNADPFTSEPALEQETSSAWRLVL